MNRKLVAATPLLLLTLAFASPAGAKVAYALHLGLNNPVMDDAAHYEGGINAEAQAGLALPFPLFDLELEAKLGMNTWAPKASGDKGTNIFRASAGVRGGVNFVIYPYGYAHIGYGKITGYKFGSFAAPIAEVGLGLDLTALPYVRIGLFGAYNHVMIGDGVKTTGGDKDLQWFAYGLNLSYVGMLTGDD